MAKLGRPVNFDRDSALSKAMEVFWKYGYEPASLSALREAMGISSASLYNTWGSKETLFRDALDLYIRNCGKAFLFESDPEHSAIDTLRHSLAQTAKIQTNKSHPLGCMVFLSAINCGPESEHICKMLKDLQNKRRDNIEALLSEAKKNGDISQAISINELSNILDLLLRGIALQAQDGADEDDIIKSIDLLLKPLLSASPA